MSSTIAITTLIDPAQLQAWYEDARAAQGQLDPLAPTTETEARALAYRWFALSRRFALVALTNQLREDADLEPVRLTTGAATAALSCRRRAEALEAFEEAQA